MSLSKLDAAGPPHDWNDSAKIVMVTSLTKYPYIGVVLSSLVNILWPSSKEDVWDQIKDRVEAMINEKITELVYQNVRHSLLGLKYALSDYLNAVKIGSSPEILSQKWNSVNSLFLHDQPAFQREGHEVLLLLLFAQFANLYLSFLRDGALHGKEKMGWNEVTSDDVTATLGKRIVEYTEYVDRVYTEGLEEKRKNTPTDKHECEPFRTVNKFQREMTFNVNDFRDLWQYFDVLKHLPPVADVYLDREIYTDPMGTADDSGVSVPKSPLSLPIEKITVWGWDRIDACQVEYPPHGGPDGTTSTGRMGNSRGGATHTHGGVFDLTKRGPIVAASGLSGHILNAWWFQFKDGSVTHKLGGNYRGGGYYKFQYDSHILSSVKIMGASRFYGSADCVVYGFKFEKKITPTPDMVQLLHKTSPCSCTAKELLSNFPECDHMIEDVERWMREDDWEKERTLYWEELAKTKV